MLQDKPEGGRRTIGLTAHPTRVWSRLRRPVAAEWESQSDALFFWGTTGKACDKAAYVHAVLTSEARATMQASAASLFLDIRKFFDNVDHGVLLREAQDLGYLLGHLLPLLELYSGWRILEVDGMTSRAFQA